MDKILDKIGTYQIFANLLPGAFFCLVLRYALGIQLFTTENIAEDILIYYFVGFFIGRIGSLLGKLLKTVRFIKRDNYDNFYKAEEADKKIITMQDMSNFIRSLLACILLLFISFILNKFPIDWTWVSSNWAWFAFPAVVALLLYAYKRQDNFICKRINIATKKQEKAKKGGDGE
jgi:hypothetical protein